MRHVSSGIVTDIPGPWDPVFNVDADLMTLPMRNGRTTHYGFYLFRDLLSLGKTATPIFEDPELKGLYQSTSILSKTDTHTNYRIITEGTGVHGVRDYTYELGTRNFAPTGPSRLLCTNFQLKLPMIAKNGLEVGALDLTTQTTGIFRIEDDGTCTKVLDLGIRTGKTNFSHDGNLVTFHIYSETAPEFVATGFIDNPGSEYVSNVYVLDRKTNTISKITNNTAANALYPDFLRNGRVVYAYYPHEQTSMEFRFVELR